MSSKEDTKSQAVKEGNPKEWALAGRDGDGLKEEYGEEWSIMIVEDGGSVTPVDASHTIVHGRCLSSHSTSPHAPRTCRRGRFVCLDCRALAFSRISMSKSLPVRPEFRVLELKFLVWFACSGTPQRQRVRHLHRRCKQDS